MRSRFKDKFVDDLLELKRNHFLNLNKLRELSSKYKTDVHFKTGAGAIRHTLSELTLSTLPRKDMLAILEKILGFITECDNTHFQPRDCAISINRIVSIAASHNFKNLSCHLEIEYLLKEFHELLNDKSLDAQDITNVISAFAKIKQTYINVEIDPRMAKKIGDIVNKFIYFHNDKKYRSTTRIESRHTSLILWSLCRLSSIGIWELVDIAALKKLVKEFYKEAFNETKVSALTSNVWALTSLYDATQNFESNQNPFGLTAEDCKKSLKKLTESLKEFQDEQEFTTEQEFVELLIKALASWSIVASDLDPQENFPDIEYLITQLSRLLKRTSDSEILSKLICSLGNFSENLSWAKKLAKLAPYIEKSANLFIKDIKNISPVYLPHDVMSLVQLFQAGLYSDEKNNFKLLIKKLADERKSLTPDQLAKVIIATGQLKEEKFFDVQSLKECVKQFCSHADTINVDKYIKVLDSLKEMVKHRRIKAWKPKTIKYIFDKIHVQSQQAKGRQIILTLESLAEMFNLGQPLQNADASINWDEDLIYDLIAQFCKGGEDAHLKTIFSLLYYVATLVKSGIVVNLKENYKKSRIPNEVANKIKKNESIINDLITWACKNYETFYTKGSEKDLGLFIWSCGMLNTVVNVDKHLLKNFLKSFLPSENADFISFLSITDFPDDISKQQVLIGASLLGFNENDFPYIGNLINSLRPESNLTSKDIELFLNHVGYKKENSFFYAHYYKEYFLHGFYVDLYIEFDNRRIVIERDGFHHKKEPQLSFDKFRDKYLESFGYEIYRIDNPMWVKLTKFDDSNLHKHTKSSKRTSFLTELEDSKYSVLPSLLEKRKSSILEEADPELKEFLTKHRFLTSLNFFKIEEKKEKEGNAPEQTIEFLNN